MMTSRKSTDSRQREIVDAAVKIIAGQGLARFTVRTIAEEVGLTDAALFRHFASKEAIVMAVIDRVSEALLESLRVSGGDPLERLGRFFQHRTALLQSQPGLAQLITSEHLSQVAPPEGVERLQGLRRESVAFIRTCLEEAKRDGVLAGGVGVEEASVLTLGALMALSRSRASLEEANFRSLPYSVWLLLEHLLRDDRPAGRSGKRRPRASPADPAAAIK